MPPFSVRLCLMGTLNDPSELSLMLVSCLGVLARGVLFLMMGVRGDANTAGATRAPRSAQASMINMYKRPILGDEYMYRAKKRAKGATNSMRAKTKYQGIKENTYTYQNSWKIVQEPTACSYCDCIILYIHETPLHLPIDVYTP